MPPAAAERVAPVPACGRWVPNSTGLPAGRGAPTNSVKSQSGPSPLLLRAVRRKLEAAFLPLWPLEPQQLTILVRDWELVSVYAEKAWQEDNAACVMCASYICQLLRDLAHGTRRMVPVAPGVQLPVLISSLEPGRRGENWPTAFGPFLDKIQNLLADWDKSPRRLCPRPKFEQLYLMVASGIDDLLFWNLGDVQRFGIIFCQAHGLPTPRCPVSVWYQFFRDCDDGARTSLCLKTAARFAKHLLERILSFFESTPEASVPVEPVLCIPSLATREVPLQIDCALDSSTGCPSLVTSSRSELTSPARSHREPAAPTVEAGLQTPHFDSAIVEDDGDASCNEIPDVTSTVKFPALPLEDSFFSADLAKCPGEEWVAAAPCDDHDHDLTVSFWKSWGNKVFGASNHRYELPEKERSDEPKVREVTQASASKPQRCSDACDDYRTRVSCQPGSGEKSLHHRSPDQKCKRSGEVLAIALKEMLAASQPDSSSGREKDALEQVQAVAAQVEACLDRISTMNSRFDQTMSVMKSRIDEVCEQAASRSDIALEQVARRRFVDAVVKSLPAHERSVQCKQEFAAQVDAPQTQWFSIFTPSISNDFDVVEAAGDAALGNAAKTTESEENIKIRQSSRDARGSAPQAGDALDTQWFSVFTDSISSDFDVVDSAGKAPRGRSMEIYNMQWVNGSDAQHDRR